MSQKNLSIFFRLLLRLYNLLRHFSEFQSNDKWKKNLNCSIFIFSDSFCSHSRTYAIFMHLPYFFYHCLYLFENTFLERQNNRMRSNLMKKITYFFNKLRKRAQFENAITFKCVWLFPNQKFENPQMHSWEIKNDDHRCVLCFLLYSVYFRFICCITLDIVIVITVLVMTFFCCYLYVQSTACASDRKKFLVCRQESKSVYDHLSELPIRATRTCI